MSGLALSPAPELDVELEEAAEIQSTGVHSGAVEVLELEEETDDDDEDQIALSALPEQVVAALNERFPGADVFEADYSIEDGDPEYGVGAVFNGRTIEVTLTPVGEIIEIEEPLSADELPQAVLDWVRENFPGAEIDEAAVVNAAGIVSYEVLIAAAGGREFEANLRVQTGPAPGTSDEDDEAPEERLDVVATGRSVAISSAGEHEVVLEPEPSEVLERGDSATPAPEAADATGSQAEEEKIAVEADQAALAQMERDGKRSVTDVYGAGVRGGQAALVVEALQAMVRGAGPPGWLPQAAGVLSEILPIDIAAVERGLQEILRELDLIAKEFGGNTARDGGASQPAMLVAVVAAALLLLDSSKPRDGPVQILNAGNSSWSWVVGAARPRRRQSAFWSW